MRVFVGYGFSGRPPPYRTPWGVHLPLCSPFGAPQSAKPCYKWRGGEGGGYLLLMDWLVSYSVSLGVCLTFICTHVDTSGFPLYLILSRSKEVDKEFICRKRLWVHGLDGWGIVFRFPVRGMRVLSPKRPDRPWRQPTVLSSEYRAAMAWR
jgi:hypothetical protein